MILYNLTINIENDVHEEWLAWAKEIHIPKAMKTSAFTEYRIFKLLNEEDNGGTTYCIQYFANNMWDVEDYQENYSPGLLQEFYDKFPDKFVIFSTVLETV
ncbi:MAG TPA: DUF4286 family protein [Cytophagales bacterium]|nr:DUF4286 family protein [Cytophagales bacterium]